MFLSKASIKRPITMTCVIIAMLLFGINSYRKLGLDFFPDVEVPYVTITTVYPGASPQEIEVDVAKKIEDAVSTIDGVKHITSTCMENVCQTLMEFNLDVDVDVAATDVRERIDLILKDLPADVEPPKILKFDPNATPIITLLLVGDLPLDYMYDFADEKLSDKLSTISGVAEVQIAGGEKLELHITLSKEKLASCNITVPDIIEKLKQSNVKIPSGRIKQGIQEINVTYDSEFKNFHEIRELEIGKFKGRRIYLGDIATVKMISKEKRTLAFYNGQPAISLKVVKKGDANAVRVISRVKKVVNQLKREHALPGDTKLIWFNDSGKFIQASVNDAWFSIMMGILLTALILFLFLHEPRSTFIIALSMPVSIIITFGIMAFFSFTFNQFTLLALGTSVGVLVTNSIVVIENIFKKLTKGEDVVSAADRGTAEVAIPVFASAMTNVMVFVPIALMTSLVGRFLVAFAITITAATLVSLFISFTLTPILASKFLREKMPEPKPFFKKCTNVWNKFYYGMENGFGRSIDWVSKYPWVPLCTALLLIVTTAILIVPRVGTSFIPENDRGEFIIKLEFPTDYNIDTTLQRTEDVAKRIRELKNVLRTSTIIGKVQGVIGQASEGVYLSEITAITTPMTKRSMDIDEMRDMFREALSNLTNCIVTVNIPSAIGGSAAMMEMKISGDDLNRLNSVGDSATAILRNSGHGKDIDNSVRKGKPEIKVLPKRPVLQNLNIPSTLIGTILRGSLEGIEAGTYKIGARSFDIRVELEDRKGIEQISEFSFGDQEGKPLNIEVVSGLKKGTMDIQINRSDKERTVKVFANPARGTPLGKLAQFASEEVGKILPPGYKARFSGQVEVMKEAQDDFKEAIILAVILTYLLIAAILESWTQPFLILFTIPLAFIGLFWGLFFAGLSLSIFGLLGAVMLIGIVVNNAILIMDDVIMYRRQNIAPKQSMCMAVKNKFRPILMTSIAAVLGIIPMALGTGLGSETRASCGITVIGGLISSAVLSLYVIPAMYFQFVRKNKDESVELK
jgi:HAE1 family hydrophobic/amphiphilic exporter-1